MLGQLCAWAESTWPEVGRVDRRDQQNTLFVTLMGLAKGIEAYWSPFFADFDRFIVLTCRLDATSWDLVIFVPTDDDNRRQTTDKTDCFTPCACTQGNNCPLPPNFLEIGRRGIDYYVYVALLCNDEIGIIQWWQLPYLLNSHCSESFF